LLDRIPDTVYTGGAGIDFDMNEIRQAMILAAGEGTRLRPLTLDTPKILLPLAGEPLLKHLLAWLARNGCSEVAINLHHLHDKTRSYLGDGSSFGLKNVFYSFEETVLGTAGGIKRAEAFFTSTFVVVYGDVVPVFNLEDMFRFHRQREAIVTLALIEMPKPWEVGIVEINPDGKISSFVEKPPRNSGRGNLGNGGVYILEKEVLSHIPPNRYYDFGHDVFPQLLERGLPVYGYRLPVGEYIIDIGDTERYEQAERNIASGRISFEVS
jgi:NDP-sugar pyrophosphorylase family protein